MDFWGIFFGFATFVSLLFNYRQYIKRQNLEENLRSHLQSSFNHFRRIKDFTNYIRNAKPNNIDDFSESAKNWAHAILGISEASNLSINSSMREHLKCVPRIEDIDKPSPDPLQKVNKKKAIGTTQPA